jgi:hypothetical protein
VGQEALRRKVIGHVDREHRDHQRHHTAVGEHEHGLAAVGVGDVFEGVLEPFDNGVTVLRAGTAGAELPAQPSVEDLLRPLVLVLPPREVTDRELLQTVERQRLHTKSCRGELPRLDGSLHPAVVHHRNPSRSQRVGQLSDLCATQIRQPSAAIGQDTVPGALRVAMAGDEQGGRALHVTHVETVRRAAGRVGTPGSLRLVALEPPSRAVRGADSVVLGVPGRQVGDTSRLMGG